MYEAGSNSFVLSPGKWIETTSAIGITTKSGRYGGTFAKVNYLIHADAIKENLIPPDLQKSKQKFIYADEADLLNLALFGQTALAWKNEYPERKGNMRDYATLEQLVVLSNLESFNAELIKIGMNAEERLRKLNSTAIEQMKVLIKNKSLDGLRGKVATPLTTKAEDKVQKWGSNGK